MCQTFKLCLEKVFDPASGEEKSQIEAQAPAGQARFAGHVISLLFSVRFGGLAILKWVQLGRISIRPTQCERTDPS